MSTRVHGRYLRQPMDLPWRGHPVRLTLTVRRFRCDNSECERTTFAEDCGKSLPRYARRTLGANHELLSAALIAGAEAGSRLAAKHRLPVSADTLLRLQRRSPASVVPTPRILGVDDLALRRRQTYATIFVDLETRRPVDLVEGRDAETLVNWLKAHPGVEVISRDRAEGYAEGARVGAPNAVQVADRFHLVQNASTALDGMLRGRRLNVGEEVDQNEVGQPELARSADSKPEPEVVPTATQGVTPAERSTPTKPLSPTKQFMAQRREARVARWEKVNALAKVGMSPRGIARQVGISRKTVRHLLGTPEPPRNQVKRLRPGGLKSPTLQPYLPYLQDRWQAGCTNVAQLFREIVERGYPGSRSLLSQALQPWRGPKVPRGERRKVRRMTRRLSMRWIYLRPPEQLKPEERALLDKLLAHDEALALGHGLVQRFRQIVSKRDLVGLDQWLEEAKASNLPTFVGLANGIEADRAAVDAAFKLPWSNGPVEGHINRVKLIKRQGYGRAKLDLLRIRMLAA